MKGIFQKFISIATTIALCLSTISSASAALTLEGTSAKTDTNVVGIVAPITTMDVTVPLNMNFFIKEDRTLEKNAAYIESNTAAPLDVKAVSVEKIVQDDYITAPDLVKTNHFDDWNNISIRKTRENIHIELNGVDLSDLTLNDYIGNIRSAYSEDVNGNFTPNTKTLKLEITECKYGKAWDNLTNETFGYIICLEFSMYDGTHDFTDSTGGESGGGTGGSESGGSGSGGTGSGGTGGSSSGGSGPESGGTDSGMIEGGGSTGGGGSSSGSSVDTELTEAEAAALWTYRDLTNDNLTLQTYIGSNGSDVDVVIPTKIGAKTVVGVENTSSNGLNSNTFKSIYIPSGLYVGTPGSGSSATVSGATIGDLTISDNVQLNGYTFKNSKIENLTIGSGVSQTISSNYSVFHGTTANLASATVKNAVVDSAINMQCLKLESITFGNNIRSLPNLNNIGKSTNANIFTTLTIPGNIKTIGTQTVYKVSTLETLVLEEGIESIGKQAFASCTGLTSVVIPNSVTTMYDQAFEGCTSLSSITIGTGLTSITAKAFQNTAVETIDIPSNITEIGTKAFNGCSALTTVNIHNTEGNVTIASDAIPEGVTINYLGA